MTMNISTTISLPEELIKEINTYLQAHPRWPTRESFFEKLITSSWEQMKLMAPIKKYFSCLYGEE